MEFYESSEINEMYSRRTLTPQQKERILERDSYVCVYCLDDATEVDHVVPFSWSQCDDPDNLVSSCEICNGIASNLMFDDFDLKSEYIRTVRQSRKWSRRLKRAMRAQCNECKRHFRPLYRNATLFVCYECTKIVC